MVGFNAEEFIGLSWISASKMGSYLVATTPSAAVHIKENLIKHQATNYTESEISQKVFDDFQCAPGLHTYELDRLKCLFSVLLTKSSNEEDALREYVYALRNMLMHSIYKPTIKQLERPSNDLQNINDFLQYLIASDWHKDVEQSKYKSLQYTFLYSFITTIQETSKLISKLTVITKDSVLTPKFEPFTQYLSFTQRNNEIVTLFDRLIGKQAPSETHIADMIYYVAQFADSTLTREAFDELSKDEQQLLIAMDDGVIQAEQLLKKLQVYKQTESWHELLKQGKYFSEKFTQLEQFFTMNGFSVHELIAQTTLSLTDLQLLKTYSEQEKPKKQLQKFVTQLFTLALIKQLSVITGLIGHIGDGSKQPLAKESKPIQPNLSFKKELNDMKNEKRRLEAENARLQKVINDIQKENEALQERFRTAQQERDKLRHELDQQQHQKPLEISHQAKDIVEDLSVLLAQLKIELEIEDEPASVEDFAEVNEPSFEEMDYEPDDDGNISDNYIDKIEHIKFAVVGGHDKYHQRLKQTFPQDVFTVSPNRLNSSLQKLLNYDVIVIVTSYNNHSLYKRTFDYLKKNQLKERCLHINSQPNPKLLAKQVYEFTIK